MTNFKQFFSEGCGLRSCSDEETVSVEEWKQRLEELRDVEGEEFHSIAARIDEILDMYEYNEVDQDMVNELERDYQAIQPELVDQLNQSSHGPSSSDKWNRAHGEYEG